MNVRRNFINHKRSSQFPSFFFPSFLFKCPNKTIRSSWETSFLGCIYHFRLFITLNYSQNFFFSFAHRRAFLDELPGLFRHSFFIWLLATTLGCSLFFTPLYLFMFTCLSQFFSSSSFVLWSFLSVYNYMIYLFWYENYGRIMPRKIPFSQLSFREDLFPHLFTSFSVEFFPTTDWNVFIPSWNEKLFLIVSEFF